MDEVESIKGREKKRMRKFEMIGKTKEDKGEREEKTVKGGNKGRRIDDNKKRIERREEEGEAGRSER